MKKIIILKNDFTAVMVDATRKNNYSDICRIWNLSDLEVQAIKHMDSNERLYVYNVTSAHNEDYVCRPNTLLIEDEIVIGNKSSHLYDLHMILNYCEVAIIDL